MKLHKRLMQSLADAKKQPVINQEWHPLVRKISVREANNLAQGIAVPARKVCPENGALKFIGTQIKRWDGEQWVNHRMPGMHRRGGKWVRR
jgi:hypothetical protein